LDKIILVLVFLKNPCIAGLWKDFLRKNGGKRSRPDDQVIFLALSAWTEITHIYYDGLFFHHILLKILAISKDMPVLFASSGKKIVFVKYGTYLCPSTY
jgi:hypothetical protein